MLLTSQCESQITIEYFPQNKSRALPVILGSKLSSQINEVDDLGLAPIATTPVTELDHMR